MLNSYVLQGKFSIKWKGGKKRKNKNERWKMDEKELIL